MNRKWQRFVAKKSDVKPCLKKKTDVTVIIESWIGPSALQDDIKNNLVYQAQSLNSA